MILWVTCDRHRTPTDGCTRCRDALGMNRRQALKLGVAAVDEWNRALP